MKSIRHVGRHPAGHALVSDDITEFHAARLLLLIALAGTAGRIDGLTKLAKLDFFARYPEFFRRACDEFGIEVSPDEIGSGVEAPMIRFHYGPWDTRYYQVLPFLEGLGLLRITKEVNTYTFALTDTGKEVARQLARRGEFAVVVRYMRAIKAAFGRKSGTSLKDMIYQVFQREVTGRRLGEVIRGVD